eukprot:6203842-Prymnesium_polylepis.1
MSVAPPMAATPAPGSLFAAAPAPTSLCGNPLAAITGTFMAKQNFMAALPNDTATTSGANIDGPPAADNGACAAD